MQEQRPKQYLLLCGRPLILHSLERIVSHPSIQGLLVGLASEDRFWPGLASEVSKLPKILGIYQGGAERADTVWNGLNALQGRARSGDWVMVHDAARPCVRRADIDALIAAASVHADGALLAVPISDTVKRVDERGEVIETASREKLWRAVTPQLFPLDKLKAALDKARGDGISVTDEAAAVEHAGGHPRVVAGHADNIKITLAEDLALAEFFLSQQEGA